MKKDIWKVGLVSGYSEEFERLCKEQNIFYKSYPEPLKNIYRVECPKDELLDMGWCIATIEEMPVMDA